MMSGEAWLYLLAVLINAVNLFLQVFFTIMYSDLEWYALSSSLLCPLLWTEANPAAQRLHQPDRSLQPSEYLYRPRSCCSRLPDLPLLNQRILAGFDSQSATA